MSQWIMRELGPDVPLHFTAFHPDFEKVGSPGYGKLYTTLMETPATSPAGHKFLGNTTAKVPFVIAVAGSVAVGKSTTARLLQTLLAEAPAHPYRMQQLIKQRHKEAVINVRLRSSLWFLPTILVLASMAAWNDFLWPLFVINDKVYTNIVMSKKCTIEVKDKGGNNVTVKLYGEGKQVNRVDKPLPRGEVLTIGGDLKGRTIGVLGLTFKPNTDDMREAPSRVLMEAVWAEGGKVRAYDPIAMDATRRIYGDRSDLVLVDSAEAACEGADALALVTEWSQFRSPDFAAVKALMKNPAVFDGRNLYDPAALKRLGFHYQGIGRKSS